MICVLGHVPECLTEPSYGPVESGVKLAARTCKKLRKFDGLLGEVVEMSLFEAERKSQVKALQQLTVNGAAELTLLTRAGSFAEILDIKGFAALFVLGYTGATAVSRRESASVGCGTLQRMVNRSSKSGSSRPSPESRRQAVLAAIIHEHLLTGDAIGSHAVSEKFAHAAGWSSATIRNVMAELDEFGLLEQPHTSAGRIPTDRGYRYYVDNIISGTRLSKSDLKAIEDIGTVEKMTARPDRLMERASHVLSELSENVGIVVWPSLAENGLQHISFLNLPDSRILVAIVSTPNIVQDKVITLDEKFTQDELDGIARYLNTEFRGKNLRAIRGEIVRRMKEERDMYDGLLRNAVLLCERSMEGEESSGGEVYIDGAFNILTKPEFANREKLRELLQTLEEKSRLVKILTECLASDPIRRNVKVIIGNENVMPSMKSCAVITASYQLDGDVSGTLGVVGPTRIEYGRTMAVVNYLARFIERALSNEAAR
jgi:heat-inducible transcriptional repressor